VLWPTWLQLSKEVLGMGDLKHGQGENLPPSPEMLKSVFLLQMLSETSADEVLMHHFEKMSSASGASPPEPHRAAAPCPCWGLASVRPPHCPPLEKILRAPMVLGRLSSIQTTTSSLQRTIR